VIDSNELIIRFFNILILYSIQTGIKLIVLIDHYYLQLATIKDTRAMVFMTSR
jgi:hypothetical protein